jgi:hypothetical protein
MDGWWMDGGWMVDGWWMDGGWMVLRTVSFFEVFSLYVSLVRRKREREREVVHCALCRACDIVSYSTYVCTIDRMHEENNLRVLSFPFLSSPLLSFL